MLDIFSFFAGAGFLDLGFETENYTLAFVNEYHDPFLNAYRYVREGLGIDKPEFGYSSESAVEFLEGKNKLLLHEMVEEVRKRNNIVGFIAGPPCPDFSVGGKNRGRLGEKGKLSEAYMELICQEKPDFYLFENVKGLWRTVKHRSFFEEIKYKTYQAGYVLTECLVNCIEHGVPQNRERIILLGFRCDLLSDLNIPLSNSSLMFNSMEFPWNKYRYYIAEEVFNLPWPTVSPFIEDSELPPVDGVFEKLTVEYWFRKNNIFSHANAIHHFQPRAGLEKFQTIDEGDVSKKSFKRLHRWRYSPTAAYGNNEVHIHPYKARRLSAAESLAIQSMPRAFTLPPDMSLSNMFKAIGNGVPYLTARALARTILDFLEMV